MERITRNNSALFLIDHQIGLLSGVRDIELSELKHNVVALAKAAKILGIPVVAATTAKDEKWGPLFPELQEVLDQNQDPVIDRMSVNAWDDPKFLAAVKATGKSHLLFAGITLQICAAFPAYSALGEGYRSYVVVDASGAFTDAQRETGIARMNQAGVILVDYFTILAEIMADNADPLASKIYEAIDLEFAKLVGGIRKSAEKQ